LVFTILNEYEVSQRIGIATLNVYFLLAFLSLCKVLLASNQPAAVGEAQQDQDDNKENQPSSGVENEVETDENPDHDSSPAGFDAIVPFRTRATLPLSGE
jgi:hypothetical protein